MPRPAKKSEYVVVDILKERMEADENFTKEQVRGFTKRLKTDSFKFIIENYQKSHDKCKRLSELLREKRNENLNLIDENEDLEQEIRKLTDKNCEQAIEISKMKKKIQELELQLQVNGVCFAKERKSLITK